MGMDEAALLSLIVERNTKETLPFLLVHEANATLINQVDALQKRCEALEAENAAQQRMLESGGASPEAGSTTAIALRNETRLRDKLEILQEDLNSKLRIHQEDTKKALQTARDLADAKELNKQQEATILQLEKDLAKSTTAIEYLSQKVQDAEATTKLAEKQYTGLKTTIRTLQDENDTLKAENGKLVERLVSDKEKTSDEMNELNDMIVKLKKEVDMLRELKLQEDKRKNWFGLGKKGEGAKDDEPSETEKRKFGATGVVVPTAPKHIVEAHQGEANYVRYDGTGVDLVATCGNDSLVKVWDTASGNLRATLRGTTGHSITCCDIGGGMVVGGGSDKTCRVWNLRTERMVHQLVGHASKVTCLRLFGGQRAVVTGSSDRCLKIWDITRKTYRQSTTLRHSSTAYSVDVGSDSFSVVSGHMDGGLRFWDARTGDRTADLGCLHENGITSVQFHPRDPTRVLTNGKDSRLKVIDLRTGTAVTTLQHDEYRTTYNWSSGAFSADGTYVAAVSSFGGHLFVWNAHDGELVSKLKYHDQAAAGCAWSAGGLSGQQVATTDRTGKLILWA